MTQVAASRPLPHGDAVTEMQTMIAELFPLCRSLTGDGLRQTLAIIDRAIPLERHEVPTGTPALDWTVPREWNVREAYIATPDGRRIVDFADSNLHLVQYSIPVNRVVPLAELKQHLHTLPDQPDLVPYRTGYYAENWGFCMSHRQFLALDLPEYRVVVDSRLEDGHLSYGEHVIPGPPGAPEVLISCHCCHPSLANDNLSGIAVAVMLARHLALAPRRHTYRFLFIPATIGSLVWLSRNEARVPRITHGLVLSCVGDAGPFTYKQSRQGDAAIDRIVHHVLKHGGTGFRIRPFEPYGYDERQYCSPGFDMPVGCFMRSPNGGFPEYHTSADNLDFVRGEALLESLRTLVRVVDVIERDAIVVRTDPRGEPQLGRRGLYRAISGQKEAGGFDQMTLLWVLNLADGRHTLLDMAERSSHPFEKIRAAADVLLEHDLLTVQDVTP